MILQLDLVRKFYGEKMSEMIKIVISVRLSGQNGKLEYFML